MKHYGPEDTVNENQWFDWVPKKVFKSGWSVQKIETNMFKHWAVRPPKGSNEIATTKLTYGAALAYIREKTA